MVSVFIKRGKIVNTLNDKAAWKELVPFGQEPSPNQKEVGQQKPEQYYQQTCSSIGQELDTGETNGEHKSEEQEVHRRQ